MVNNCGMSEYTPTTDEMRAFYTAERLDGPHLEGFPPPTVEQAEAEFNSWLAAHDVEVRERALREAEDAAAEALSTWWLTDTAPDEDTSSVMDVRMAVRALRAGFVD